MYLRSVCPVCGAAFYFDENKESFECFKCGTHIALDSAEKMPADNVTFSSGNSGLDIPELSSEHSGSFIRVAEPCRILELSFNIDKIESGAFEECPDIEELFLFTWWEKEDGFSISRGAFSGCGNLNTIHVGNSVYGENTVKILRKNIRIECPNAELIVEEGVTYIGSDAFRSLNVKRVTLPSTLGTIGKCAFINSEFSELTLPDGLKEIGEYAFAYCRNLKRVEIPDSVVSISEGAFMHCESLEYVKFPKNLKRICQEAFCGCRALKEAVLPEGTAAIDGWAFKDCVSLNKVVLPDSVSYIADEVMFYHDECAELRLLSEKNADSPDKVIGYLSDKYMNGTFSSRRSVRNNIPILTTREGAFHGCISLKEPSSVRVPDRMGKDTLKRVFTGCPLYPIFSATDDEELPVEYDISDGVLRGCATLKKKVLIPENVTAIEENAFTRESCPNISELVFSGTPVEFHKADKKSDRKFTFDCPLLRRISFLPCEILDICLRIGNKIDEIIVPEGVRTICGNMLEGLDFLRIYLPSTLEAIGPYAFGSSGIAELQIPDSVTYMGKCAFGECKRLRMIKLPESLEVIKESTFINCIRLESVKFPRKLKTIEENAFADCKALKNACLPNGLTDIGRSAFSCCGALEYVYLPDSLEKISTERIYFYDALASSVVDRDFDVYKEGSFDKCVSLKERSDVRVPEGFDMNIIREAFSGTGFSETIETDKTE